MNILAIDIETLATTADAVCLSIGVAFEGGHVDGVRLNVCDQIRLCRRVDPETQKWWARQDSITWWHATDRDSQMDLGDGLTLIAEKIAAFEPNEIWARGSMDQIVLENLLAQVGVAVPWRYSVWRDERTLWALAQELGLPAVKGGRANTHTALEDACACLKSVITIKDMLKALAPDL